MIIESTEKMNFAPVEPKMNVNHDSQNLKEITEKSVFQNKIAAYHLISVECIFVNQ